MYKSPFSHLPSHLVPMLDYRSIRSHAGVWERVCCVWKQVFHLVPMLQHGNAVVDASASRVLNTMLKRRSMRSRAGAWERVCCVWKQVFHLVPMLQHGNAVVDAPASRVLNTMLEHRSMRSRAGAWERVCCVWKQLFVVLLLLFLTACSKEKTTGAGEVRWDREICARCAMAVSDPKYSAQVRGGKPNKKTKLYKFDDVGCAIIWLDDQNWKDDPRTEIWVNDYKTGKWINAKTAWYVEIKNTPMDYGLGAQTEKVTGALNYQQAREHIYKVEQRFNQHKAQPSTTIKPPAEEK